MSEGMNNIAPVSGAIGISSLRVYTTAAPDGLAGGCPHMHFTCTESYAVLEGHGSVQILGYEGFREVALQPGSLLWYTPGIIHRLINRDGKLKLLVIMQNSGLPEAGDHVLIFPPEVLSNRGLYYQKASLASAEGHVYASDEEAAFRRRDLAVEGFNQLREKFESQGKSAMEEFYKQAITLVQDKVSDWQRVWKNKILSTCEKTEKQLKAVKFFNTSHLKNGKTYLLPSPEKPERFGFCGWLSPYNLEETLCNP